MRVQKFDEQKGSLDFVKNLTVQFGKAWVETMVRQYTEPVRAGTPKGEPIGLSKKKYRTSLLMILYGGLGLGIKEIAKIAGVSEGLIRLWRTEPDFKKAAQNASDSFGEQMATTIDLLVLEAYKKIGWTDKEKIFENGLSRRPHFKLIKFPFAEDPKDPISAIVPLSDMVPFFNEAIFPVIVARLRERIDAGSLYHGLIALRMMRVSVAKDNKKLRKWTVENLEFTKTQVESDLKFLTEPSLGEEDKKMLMLALRNTIFRTFDILAF